MSITKTCKIENCTSNNYLASGLCNTHYIRKSRNIPYDYVSNREKRPAIIEDKLVKIPIGKSAKDGYAFVDKEFSWLGDYKWSIKCGYATGRIKSKEKLFMHRVIMDIDNKKDVDHINHDKLDNRKANLRFVTKQQNMMNTKMYSNNSSGYKGVIKIGNKYKSRIIKNRNQYCGGTFITKEEAALSYNQLAIKHFGEYAYLNKV